MAEQGGADGRMAGRWCTDGGGLKAYKRLFTGVLKAGYPRCLYDLCNMYRRCDRQGDKWM